MVPGVVDPFWLNGAAHTAQAIGTPLAGQPLTATATVPNTSALQGAVFAWQAVSIDAAGQIIASNPAPFSLR